MGLALNRSSLFLKNYNFFYYGTNALLMPFLPLYLHHTGFNALQIGLLMAMGPIISLVSNPFWGYWSDSRQNVRRIVLVMLIGTFFTSQFLFHIDVFVPLIFAMLLFFFFQTGIPTMNNMLILEAVKNSAQQFGTFRLWGSLGFAIISVVSSWMIAWLGIGHLGLLYGVFLLLPILLCFGLPRSEQGGRKASLKGMSSLFTNGYYVVFLLLSVLDAIPNRMNSTFISLFLNQFGASSAYVGWCWFLAAIGEVPIFLLLDKYLKISSKAMVGILTFVSLLYSVRWMLMGIAQSPWQILAIQILHSLTFGVYIYTGTHLCAHLTPKGYQASGQAWYALFWKGLAGIAAGLIGGWIYTTVGPREMYGIGCALSVFGTIGFFFMWRRLIKRDKQPSASVDIYQ